MVFCKARSKFRHREEKSRHCEERSDAAI